MARKSRMPHRSEPLFPQGPHFLKPEFTLSRDPLTPLESLWNSLLHVKARPPMSTPPHMSLRVILPTRTCVIRSIALWIEESLGSRLSVTGGSCVGGTSPMTFGRRASVTAIAPFLQRLGDQSKCGSTTMAANATSEARCISPTVSLTRNLVASPFIGQTHNRMAGLPHIHSTPRERMSGTLPLPTGCKCTGSSSLPKQDDSRSDHWIDFSTARFRPKRNPTAGSRSGCSMGMPRSGNVVSAKKNGRRLFNWN